MSGNSERLVTDITICPRCHKKPLAWRLYGDGIFSLLNLDNAIVEEYGILNPSTITYEGICDLYYAECSECNSKIEERKFLRALAEYCRKSEKSVWK